MRTRHSNHNSLPLLPLPPCTNAQMAPPTADERGASGPLGAASILHVMSTFCTHSCPCFHLQCPSEQKKESRAQAAEAQSTGSRTKENAGDRTRKCRLDRGRARRRRRARKAGQGTPDSERRPPGGVPNGNGKRDASILAKPAAECRQPDARGLARCPHAVVPCVAAMPSSPGSVACASHCAR